ncbi:MAG: hypothetical protein Q7K35_05625 [bacterium]|nr:hypothetical protein [bacterium]
MPEKKMNPFNPEVKRSIDPQTGVILTPEEEAVQKRERNNPMEEREQK